MAERSATVGDVKAHIESLSRFRDLDPGYFAPENGAADIVAQNLQRDMKITQVRKLFNWIKSIEMRYRGQQDEEALDRAAIYLLLPELAYARGRKLITADFYELMKTCLDERRMRTVGDFRVLVRFLEAVLAYHKMRTAAAGGGAG